MSRTTVRSLYVAEPTRKYQLRHGESQLALVAGQSASLCGVVDGKNTGHDRLSSEWQWFSGSRIDRAALDPEAFVH